ncbi:condensin-2 complex subunit G2 [Hemicordylus capensis]|uniref:condensin-2 complex subunit G2 n=1 Tax=Hemicordylus capensis TaxID=884348 RepID=UPI0023044A93|nr:condensin-2 complex subunit G2 [Hemicordylus capensis]XP_053122188.1 condensin-2 complex subunit G2 [Hemicordylus capensis]XP_053122189.1 condensin-2 complex subunit G2 [Hemicordylus capensis]
MAKREAFLQAVFNGAIDEFLHFIQLHKSAADSFDLNELLQELSRKQKESLWEKLKCVLTEILVEDPVEEWQRVGEVCHDDDNMEMERAPQKEQTIAVIQGVTTVVTASISIVDENANFKAVLECALILNGILYALPDSEKSLSRAIHCLCERWWERGLEAKEQFGKAAFIMLLKNNLEKKTVVGADVIRLWHLHQALLCFDYDSEESNDVKDLLLQCFMSVSHIKKEEGRRFLSFLFTWNVNFIKMIHGTIKNQLLCFPRSLMTHIAEIYFRAWKKASGEILEVIEHGCIQDFMHHAIHLPRNSPLHPKVRELLSYFHRQNKCRQGVEEVLYRLYQPILWRALKARNSEVRSNAALLFVDAFPILDPHFNKEDTDNEIQRQFDGLFTLLEDPQPLVRSTGILGVSKIAFKYWEMIPATVLADLFKTLTEDLAFDSTSADVRCSVFKCLPIILDNVLSHPLLEELLPILKNSLHDNSEKVRVAFVDMLLKIKAVRAAKFWKICPIEHLLTRLEIDSRPVSRRLVNLLFSSFLPIDQPEEVWCERCIALIQMNPAAARKFYQYAYEYTTPTNIAKLMLTIQSCLNTCIQQKLKATGSDVEDSEKENMSVPNDILSVDDVPSMAGLLEVIVILWRSIHKALDHNEGAKNHIVRKFASVLPEYFKIFKDDRCVPPVIILTSFMPPAVIPAFSCGVISKLRNLENGAIENKYSTLLDCLCRWGKVGHVLDLIYDWITAKPSIAEANRTSERRVRIQEMHESKPELALDYVEYLLMHSMNRDCLLSLSKEKLNQLLKVLEAAKDVLDSYSRETHVESPGFHQATALRAFGLYCRLCIHLQYKFASEGQDYLSALEETGAWIENRILPAFSIEETEQASEMVQLVVQTYLTVCKDFIAVGLGDSEFQANLLNMSAVIIHTDRGYVFVPLLLCILKEMVEASLACHADSSGHMTELLDNIQKMFQKILECLALRLRRQREEGIQLIRSIQEPLGEFIHTVQCCTVTCSAVHHGVLSSLLAAGVVEIGYTLQQKASNMEELSSPKTFSELPPLSSTLIATVNKSANMVRSFLNELMESIESEEIEGIVSIAATVHIIALLKGKHKSSCIKDIASALQKKLTACSEIAREDVSSTQRTLYQTALHVLDEILSP